jgi:hypothetical protein
MPPTSPASAEKARELLRKNADLATWMAALGARGATAAAGLTRGGTPPPDDLVQDLGEAGREFAALRAEVFATATACGIKTPATAAIDSTKRLEAMLRLLLDGLEQAERLAGQARARAATKAVLERVLALTHRDDPAFAALAGCQARASDLSAKLETAAEVGADALVPFTALLTLTDGQQKNLDDEKWGALEDAVATAFGRSLAVAASRGKLHTR